MNGIEVAIRLIVWVSAECWSISSTGWRIGVQDEDGRRATQDGEHADMAQLMRKAVLVGTQLTQRSIAPPPSGATTDMIMPRSA